MAIKECYVGETLTIGVDDLTSIVTGPVTSGATVVMSITNGDGDTEDSATVTTPLTGATWRAALDAPIVPGSYFVVVSATYNGKTWRGKRRITVNRF